MKHETESSQPVAAEPVARTPQDYAIEHAEYMAKAGEHLMQAVVTLDKAQADAEAPDGPGARVPRVGGES